jgi:hypothetical protein
MLIANRFQDENHKEKCAICRCPVEELLKEFSIKLNLGIVKELNLRAFEIGLLQVVSVVKILLGKACTKKLFNKFHTIRDKIAPNSLKHSPFEKPPF